MNAVSIPGYAIERLLGRGGMAEVFVARQLSVDREVAIKLVQPSSAVSTQSIARLENEARSLAGLQHPNIIELYEFGRTDDGALYCVMPLLPGGDLSAWDKPADPERVVELLDQLLDALEHAHAAQIIHRDLKPENILFDRHGRAVLADFGAALRARTSRLTEEGIAIGSTGYMSPEQARALEVDARSDLYSLAVVAYELLTGQMPFEGPDALAIALAQVESAPPKLPRGLEQWQRFFDLALAADPTARFASASEMREALHALPSRSALALHGWRRPRLAGAVGVAGLVLFALLWWGWGDKAAMDAEGIADLIVAGALTPPASPNALQALQSSGVLSVQDRQRLRVDLLHAVSEPLTLPADERPLQALITDWQRWQRTVTGLKAENEATAVAINQRIAHRIQAALQQALRDFDRASAQPALDLVDAWPLVPREIVELSARVRALPERGQPFADANGPNLMLVRAPSQEAAGWAISREPVSHQLYAQFQRAKPGRETPCVGTKTAAQGCISYAQAQELASWLSERTGQRYRLPTREELVAAQAQIEDAAMLAWTQTCHQVSRERRRNVAQRAWSGVKSLFGRESAPVTETHCEGQIALRLDGSAESRVMSAPSAELGVVVLREIAPLQP